MEVRCLSKMLLAGIFTLVFLAAVLPCSNAQGITEAAKEGVKSTMAGKYRKVKGHELLILHDDHTFLCLRNYVQQSDAIIPVCDTLASGLWNQRKTFITLKNRPGFNKIDYSIEEAETRSPDSLYFKIILPEDDALHYGNFRFLVVPQPISGRLEQSGRPEFAMLNNMRGTVNFSLSISNIAPNCESGRKCYQRLAFHVFDSYKASNAAANYFTITLKNFNQCFYEAMDVDGEIIGIEGAKLFWRGNIYAKVD